MSSFKLFEIPREKLQVIDGVTPRKKIYFGNMISSSADEENISEWDPNRTDYQERDVVKIEALKTKYEAKVDNPKGHPHNNNNWYPEAINKYRHLDADFETQTVFSGECIVRFNIVDKTHIIGQGIENAKEIKLVYYDLDGNEVIDTFDCYECRDLPTKKTLATLERFDCYDPCCNNPGYNYIDHFTIALDDIACENIHEVEIVITKIDDSKPILVRTLVVAKEHELACPEYGIEVTDELPKRKKGSTIIRDGLEDVQIESSLRVNIKTTVEKAKEIRKMIIKHGAYLNYYALDESIIDGAMILGTLDISKVRVTSNNRAEIPIEITGIQY